MREAIPHARLFGYALTDGMSASRMGLPGIAAAVRMVNLNECDTLTRPSPGFTSCVWFLIREETFASLWRENAISSLLSCQFYRNLP